MNSQHLNEKKSHLGVDYFEKMHIIKNRKEDEVAIMLIQFNFKNFRSFREEATLDLSATKMTEFTSIKSLHRKSAVSSAEFGL